MDRSELLKTKHMFEFQKLARDLGIAKFSEFEEAEMKHFVTFFLTHQMKPQQKTSMSPKCLDRRNA